MLESIKNNAQEPDELIELRKTIEDKTREIDKLQGRHHKLTGKRWHFLR